MNPEQLAQQGVVWDADGAQWVAGPDGWYAPDCPPGPDDRCYTLALLAEEHGPLSATPPKAI